MAYQMAVTAMTLNDLEVIHRLQAFSNAIRRTFVQHFTRFQLTVCSHGSSALAASCFLSWEMSFEEKKKRKIIGETG